MDPGPYRRRQRRRAAIGWGALIAIVALVAVGIAVDGDGGGHDEPTVELEFLGVNAEMSASDYESLHRGAAEEAVIGRIGSGLREDQVQQGLLELFPARPDGSQCAFWDLSDAPEHLVRLCFDDERGVLLQKSVAARGEGGPPKTLA